jgi:hypothetical protein
VPQHELIPPASNYLGIEAGSSTDRGAGRPKASITVDVELRDDEPAKLSPPEPYQVRGGLGGHIDRDKGHVLRIRTLHGSPKLIRLTS